MVEPLPSVVIVGRPNVGKSTLFNRLTGTRRSIVTDEPGITRDRIYGTAEWRGRAFEVVDTGGIVPEEKAEIPREVLRQAEMAIAAATQLVLVVDARAGLTPLDAELARRLRRTGRPLVVAANKVDHAGQEGLAAPFHALGVPVFPISAEHGLGVDALLDAITERFPVAAATEAAEAVVNIAIIGRPNVGKSTLLNRLVGAERAIVSAEPGTTRDAVDTVVVRGQRRYRFIDTAGIRRKAKTKLLAERLSVMMARRHLERADVALLVADAAQGVTSQDAAIAGYAEQSGCSVILVLNKWDLALEQARQARADSGRAPRPQDVEEAELLEEYTRLVRAKLKFLDYAPVVFVSARTGERVSRLYPLIDEVAEARRRRIPTAELNRWLREVDLERGSAPAGRAAKILYMTQASVAPPVFVLFASRAGTRRAGTAASGAGRLHFSFARFLENRLRERFPFPGTPIRFLLRTRPPRTRRESRGRQPR
jgi:GTP-binding protein